jgi:hypothetical protein
MIEALQQVAPTPYPNPMPTEAPSPFVRLSPDVIFSREVLCHHIEEEPFSLSGSTVRRAPRTPRAAAQKSAVRLDVAPAEQPFLF